MSTATFNATTTARPLWANAEGAPSIWVRWTLAHEEWVESEQPMAHGHLGTVGRIVKCGQYGTWFVGDWRPKCGRCNGTGQVEMYAADSPGGREAVTDAIADTMDGGLFYMLQASVECPACRAHPGWVVG